MDIQSEGQSAVDQHTAIVYHPVQHAILFDMHECVQM